VIRVVDTSNFKGLQYPKELNGAWFYYVFFENHPISNIDGISCIYFNDKYPSGSICTGEYLLNDYPDAYSSWGKPDEDGNVKSGRILVSPILRGQGVATAGLAYGIKMLKEVFNKTIVHSAGSEIGNKTYSSAAEIASLPKYENVGIDEGIHMKKDFFDQPVYPYVFFGRRVSE
jgi:hypothetical protein